jgi:5-methylcytosine-specific restriction endonuclease McrBC GTP-binding regulatory subunit McrB
MSSDPSLLEFLKNNPTMFQNYQAIVIKILLESDSKFSATINEIKNKIVELNFDREDFKISSGWPSVKKVLDDHNIISINGENVKLNNENISDVEKSECLKICGQKIVEFHIDKIVNGDYNLWRMPPGSAKENYPYELEFLKSNTIGVGWGKIEDDVVKKNMTKEQTEELFHKLYRPIDGISNSPQSFTNFTHEIKPKDIIVLIKKKTILDFAIVVGSYHYQKDPSIDLPDNAKSYSHRRNVVWLNRGPIPESEAFEFSRMSACDRVKDAQLKEQYLAILREEKLPRYFLLRHNAKGPWKDDPGKKYHIGRDEKDGRMGKRVRLILDAGVGTKTIWYSTSKGEFYFWGYGTVTGIEEEKKDTDWYLTYNDFKFFEGDVDVQGRKLKRATESVNQQLQELQGDKKWKMNWQFPINPIPKKIYEEITGEDLTSKKEKIDTVTENNYDRALKHKPNLILYGPPGTGKTYHAKEIAKKIQKNNKFPDFFMLKGPWSNWETNLSGDNPSWATNEVPSNLSQYNLMKVGDYVILQNNNDELGPYDDVGYFGVGKITKLFDSPKPYFPDEIEAGKILWQKRLEFEIIKKVENKTMIPRMDGLPYTKGLSSISNTDNIEKLVNKIKSKWNIILHTRSQSSKFVTFHPSYSYEDFVEGFRPNVDGEDKKPYILENGIFKQICIDAKDDDPNNKYVIIIDEINRGNIPKILGELITLIEDDKRYLKDSLQLTYSKDNFFVPKNLIILGTMNTADKSLMQMDDALKRRFVFDELMPDTDFLLEYLTGKKISHATEYCNILKRINGKILGEGTEKSDEKIKQFRDRQIGHSYFMKIENDKDLQTVIKYDVIPLLQDYFYGDYSLIQKIFSKKNDDVDYKDNTIIGDDNRPTKLVTQESKSKLLREALLEI